jgi:hypothetical protein
MSKILLFFFLPLALGCIDKTSVPGKLSEQVDCEEQKRLDSVNLMDFSKRLHSTVIARDWNEVANLFHFPFSYKACRSEGGENEGQARFINREELVAHFNDLFGNWFSETVTKGYVYYILDGYYSNNRCQLGFEYPLAVSGGNGQCKRIFISVEKFEGSYKLASAWQK